MAVPPGARGGRSIPLAARGESWRSSPAIPAHRCPSGQADRGQLLGTGCPRVPAQASNSMRGCMKTCDMTGSSPGPMYVHRADRNDMCTSGVLQRCIPEEGCCVDAAGAVRKIPDDVAVAGFLDALEDAAGCFRHPEPGGAGMPAVYGAVRCHGCPTAGDADRPAWQACGPTLKS